MASFHKIAILVIIIFLLSSSVEGKRKEIKRKGQEPKAKPTEEVKQNKGELVLKTLDDIVKTVKEAKKAKEKLTDNDALHLVQLLSSCNPDIDSVAWKEYWQEALKQNTKQLVSDIEYLFFNLDEWETEKHAQENVTLALIHTLDVLSRNSPARAVPKFLASGKKGPKLAELIVSIMKRYESNAILQTRLQMLYAGVILMQQVEHSSVSNIIERVIKNLETFNEDSYIQRTCIMLLATIRKGYKPETVIDDLYKAVPVLKKLLDEEDFEKEELVQFANDFVEDITNTYKDIHPEKTEL